MSHAVRNIHGSGLPNQPRNNVTPIHTLWECFRYLGYQVYLVPELPVGPVVHENIISEILVSPPLRKYSTPVAQSEKICFRYLGYLMYLVPEVPVRPVVPENIISEILVSAVLIQHLSENIAHLWSIPKNSVSGTLGT